MWTVVIKIDTERFLSPPIRVYCIFIWICKLNTFLLYFAGYYGPPIGSYCVVFVDDVSMPQAEVYGAQPPIEVLRQGMDLGHWYDRKTNMALHLIDVQVI